MCDDLTLVAYIFHMNFGWLWDEGGIACKVGLMSIGSYSHDLCLFLADLVPGASLLLLAPASQQSAVALRGNLSYQTRRCSLLLVSI